MRHLIPLVFLVFFCACAQEDTPTYTTITAQLPAGTPSLKADFSGELADLPLAPDGSLTDTLELTEPRYVTLKLGEFYTKLFLSPGDHLNVTATDSLPVFGGTHAAVSNYLYQNAVEEHARRSRIREILDLPEEDFLRYQDSLKRTKLARLAELPENTATFQEIERQAIDYARRFSVTQYIYYQGIFDKDYVPSAVLTGIYRETDIDNEDHAQLYSDYRYVVRQILEERTKELADTSLSPLARNLRVLADIESPTILHEQITGTLYYYNGNEENLEAMRDTMLALAKLDKTKTAITERYEIISNLQPGKPSPGFDYENYRGGTTKLADLEGKYVYVDVWATWCGPCIREIPALKKVEEKYHDANISFVSISIDELKSRDKWRKMIGDRELGGIQLLADNAWESDFVKSYGIMGIPRFILLDDKGNIVSADVERPSNPALHDRLRELNL